VLCKLRRFTAFVLSTSALLTALIFSWVARTLFTCAKVVYDNHQRWYLCCRLRLALIMAFLLPFLHRSRSQHTSRLDICNSFFLTSSRVAML